MSEEKVFYNFPVEEESSEIDESTNSSFPLNIKTEVGQNIPSRGPSALCLSIPVAKCVHDLFIKRTSSDRMKQIRTERCQVLSASTPFLSATDERASRTVLESNARVGLVTKLFSLYSGEKLRCEIILPKSTKKKSEKKSSDSAEKKFNMNYNSYPGMYYARLAKKGGEKRFAGNTTVEKKSNVSLEDVYEDALSQSFHESKR